MSVRLRKSTRVAVGRLVALLYLFCVLAPAAALANGSGPAPCFDGLLPAAVHMHDAAASAAHTHDHGGASHHHVADASKVDGHGHGPGKSGPGPCCAMLCAPAIPADLPLVTAPLRPSFSCSAESDRSLRGEAPARRYRPPIA